MKKKHVIGLSIIGVLLLIFAFTDLQISKAVYNPTSSYGLLFQAIGEFPAAVIATFCTMSLILTRTKAKSVKYILGTIGYIVILLLFAFMAALLPITYLKGSKLLIPVLAVLYIYISYVIAKKYSITNRNELRNAAIVGVLTFVFVIIAFNLLKYAWGRERFRHMMTVGSFDGFSMWLIPHGPAAGDDFMSFPSGHSANSAIMIWITLIPTFVNSLKNKKNWFLLFAVAWIILVATSRVIMGAHFASDVTMGAAISLIIFTVLEEKYIKI